MALNIALLCDAGMSTSLLVKKMLVVAEGNEEIGHIQAFPSTEIDNIVDKFDCFLVGPQIRYKLPALKAVIEAKGKKADVIDMMTYGTINGEAALKQAIELAKG